ncbi:helix-hairpin-helix domain-containing protein [Ramlibacter sp. AN1015]|uniref:ComEA family DNA-binding protein n=1 Tax=Ramlibacter sp. AN1015 TaxID=3133428 RepID=UPI0030BB91AF
MLKKMLVTIGLLWVASAIAAVDVNKATAAELDGVNGMGPSTTQLVLEARKTGQFKDWDDLIKRVKGIGPARASRLSAQGLTVSGEAFKPTAKAPAKPAAKAEAKPKMAAEPGQEPKK